MTQEDEDRNSPRHLPNGVYCAPWCGCGCKLTAFERATKEAQQLATRLGPGWEPRVWENSGWHWEARKGKLEVKPHTQGSKTRGDYMVTGYAGWMQTNPQFITHGHDTPEDAVNAAVKGTKDHLREVYLALREATS